MRTTYSMSEINGIFNGAMPGNSFELQISPSYVGIALGSVIRNTSKGTAGTITGISDNVITADIDFSLGDFYVIELPQPWIAQTPDGLVIDVECKICGFSFPWDQLIDGVCGVCFDTPN